MPNLSLLIEKREIRVLVFVLLVVVLRMLFSVDTRPYEYVSESD